MWIFRCMSSIETCNKKASLLKLYDDVVNNKVQTCGVRRCSGGFRVVFVVAGRKN